MARSFKKPILKDKPRNYKRTTAYWRPIRSKINQIISTYKVKYDDSVLDLDDDEVFYPEIDIIEQNSLMLGTELPNPKTIINDYDYCDYKIDYRIDWVTNNKDLNVKQKENKIKYSRK